MKTFDPILQTPDRVKMADERQVEYEKKLLGSTKRHNGHTMYEIDCTSGEIKPAEYDEEKIVLVPKQDLITGDTTGTTPLTVRDIICRENCLYIAALNVKSAKKKYFKWLIESKAEKIKSAK